MAVEGERPRSSSIRAKCTSTRMGTVPGEPAGGMRMNKTLNNKAWFLVLPVLRPRGILGRLPMMTVVNYSVQDTFGNNQFFWNGIGWFQELLDPSKELGGRFFEALWRTLLFSAIILAIEIPLGILVALSMPREGWTVASALC